jgi:hypothetical protein
MKYSLRSLMIVVTLVCVLLGRIAYLRQCAEFHRRNADRCALEFQTIYGIHPHESFKMLGVHHPLIESKFRAHEQLAREYDAAIYRPWTIVDAPLPPADEDEMLERIWKRINKKLGTKGNTPVP